MNALYPYRHYLIALLFLLSIALIGTVFADFLGLVNVALMYLLPVLVIALRGDMKATTVVTAVTVVTFDLLNVPPQYSFNVHDLAHAWSFVIFFVVGYTITYQARRIQANAIKEILLNTLSHDLKTPLSSIIGNAALLLKDKNIDDTTRRDVLIQIKDEGQKMNRLIANLLDSARLRDDRQILRYEWCDFEDLIGVAMQEFRHEGLHHAIEVKVAQDLPLYWGDSGLLVRLFVNLLDNALKYAEPEKAIRVDMTSTSEKTVILFCNGSEPIKKADLKNMFDRFYRLDNTADIGGSGIGLSICKDIVLAHGGQIEAYNSGGDVCIQVDLPTSKRPVGKLRESV